MASRLGEETIIVESGGTSHSTSHQSGQQNGSHSYSTSSNHNWQQLGRSLLKPEEVINGLHPRVAITFTPGVPPIWTWLTRYYEKGFGAPTGLSPAKMILDSTCMFLCSAMLAALFTAGLFQHSFR